MPDKPKLNIGIILDTSMDTTEGVPQYVVHIGEWLKRQGHEVHYLVGETRRTDLTNIHSLSRNIAVSFNGSRTTIPLPTSKAKLKQFMSEHDFDVLHVQTPHHPLLAQRLIMSAKPDTAVISTFHILPYGMPARVSNRLLSLWLRPSLKRIDIMLAVSPAAADFCMEAYNKMFRPEILPNVVDYKLFHNAKPITKYTSSGKLTILFLGLLVERKGCFLLLEAVSKLQNDPTLPDFEVVICGKGPLERRLRDYIRQQNLEHIVEMTGFVSEKDKPRYYASADLAVFPSKSGESFGIVLLEAMASGKAAVLAGDNPGYRFVMSPQPETLFDPMSSDALADKLAFYLKNEFARKALARWGADYTKQFDVNVVGKKLEAIYRRALLKRRNK